VTRPRPDFTRRRDTQILHDFYGRWLEAKDIHLKAERAMWHGLLARMFTPAELAALARAGYLTDSDKRHLGITPSEPPKENQ
jgi:hypothetical protein